MTSDTDILSDIVFPVIAAGRRGMKTTKLAASGPSGSEMGIARRCGSRSLAAGIPRIEVLLESAVPAASSQSTADSA